MMTQSILTSPAKGNIQEEIVALAQELPYDSLLMLREFGRFLRFQIQQQGRTAQTDEAPLVTLPAISTQYPLMRVPPAKLLRLIGALPPLGGDALADTETIYAKD
jgi:hypothetical protein